MNLENLEIKTYKNYKELCNILEVEPKPTGNPRNAQIKEFKQYFEFVKVEGSQQIMVIEIFDKKKDKVDLRQLGGRSKYINEIGDILVNHLYIKGKESDNYSRTLSLGQTLEILGMVNPTYTIGHRYKRETADILDINLFSVYYFFNNTRSEYRKIVERALNNLQSRRVLNWHKCVMICEKPHKCKTYRKATEDEEKQIINIEKRVLELLNIRNVQEMFFNGVYRKFDKLVKEHLPSEWMFYFYAYDLTIGDEAIKIEQKFIEQSKHNLNKKSTDKAIRLLKTGEGKDEYKLVELLVDLLNYDLELDKNIKEQHEKNGLVRFAKVWGESDKYNKALEEIDAEYNGDIDMYDYFNYIASSENEIEDISL
jgi:hypothetical protein